MSIQQINKCLNCNRNKEGITFEVYIVDSEPPKFVTKHYCWTDLENLLEKELDGCADWERNKKKLFKECIAKCKQRKSFEWPWRERSIEEYGSSRWDRISTRCLQCGNGLHWDVTPYEDSEHTCSYCSNCKNTIYDCSKHFSWGEQLTPSYVCKYEKLDDCQNLKKPETKSQKDNSPALAPITNHQNILKIGGISLILVSVGFFVWFYKYKYGMKKKR